MTGPAYSAPPIHRASLEQRLRTICLSVGLNELRTRTSLAHVVVAQMPPAGVVKGGAAIKSWPGWDERYADAAEGLDVRSLADAVTWLRELIDSAEQEARLD